MRNTLWNIPTKYQSAKVRNRTANPRSINIRNINKVTTATQSNSSYCVVCLLCDIILKIYITTLYCLHIYYLYLLFPLNIYYDIISISKYSKYQRNTFCLILNDSLYFSTNTPTKKVMYYLKSKDGTPSIDICVICEHN